VIGDRANDKLPDLIHEFETSTDFNRVKNLKAIKNATDEALNSLMNQCDQKSNLDYLKRNLQKAHVHFGEKFRVVA